MPAVSLQKNWVRANLAITLTSPELDSFIWLNPDRGKTEEKRKEEPRRTQMKCPALEKDSKVFVFIPVAVVAPQQVF